MREEVFPQAEDISSNGEDWYLNRTLVVDAGQQPLRIDKFLFHKLERISRNRIQQAIKAGCIQVNGQEIKSNYKVRPGDEIAVFLPHPPSPGKLEPENIPLDIVYEDEYLVVLNKPAGMVVHPGVGNYSGTLVNALLYHFGRLPQPDGETPRPGLVHRLDKDTSGLMVVARDEYTLSHLARQFFERTVQRDYLALVWGTFDQPEGTISGHIGRHLRYRQKMDVFPEGDHGKHAVTHYRVLEDLGYVSLVKCRLETGRTHQIRVHMAWAGHPVFGDPVYGGNRIVKGTVYAKYKQFVENCLKILPRQALHARSLGFRHPVMKKDLLFKTEPPKDMREVLNRWRNYMTYLKD